MSQRGGDATRQVISLLPANGWLTASCTTSSTSGQPSEIRRRACYVVPFEKELLRLDQKYGVTPPAFSDDYSQSIHRYYRISDI